MDKLTAIRSFAAPGYTPAKRTRIFADRWYIVTMQNIERGPGDYLGLGTGEYAELLPGNKARERRDAHLNHCNRITEYTGPVYELLANEYGHNPIKSKGYYSTTDEVLRAADKFKAKHVQWVSDCLKEATLHDNMANGTSKSILTAEQNREIAERCREVAAKNMDSFRCDVKRLR
jgi:hypothetical protein